MPLGRCTALAEGQAYHLHRVPSGISGKEPPTVTRSGKVRVVDAVVGLPRAAEPAYMTREARLNRNMVADLDVCNVGADGCDDTCAFMPQDQVALDNTAADTSALEERYVGTAAGIREARLPTGQSP